MNENEIHFLGPVELEIREFPADGYVLDIGGGGEGVIGRLEGLRVVAIDRLEEELAEAPEGPLKILMDARDLKFLDGAFSAVTAFFSFMYFDTEDDLRTALKEAYRVLKPGGELRIWDVDIAARPATDKPVFAVRLRCVINGQVCETAYGRPWPTRTRDSSFYRGIAEAADFVHLQTEVSGCTFFARFCK